jgi:glyceraldehyde-3-phosphate dehydrogenase (NADP+)
MVLGRAPTATAEVLEVHDPDDGSIVGTLPLASPADVEAALARAVEGARVSKALPVDQRMAILDAAADRVEADRASVAETIAREGIKTIREARAEVGRAVETLRLSAEETRRLNGETLPFDQRTGSEDKIGYWIRQPLGVIVAITPFNDPLNLVAHKVGPALAGGNAVIVTSIASSSSAASPNGFASSSSSGPGPFGTARSSTSRPTSGRS